MTIGSRASSARDGAEGVWEPGAGATTSPSYQVPHDTDAIEYRDLAPRSLAAKDSPCET